MKIFIYFLFLISIFFDNFSKELKVLHLSLHKGCISEIEYIANALSLNLESLYIHSLQPYQFDPFGKGSQLYNIGYERAKRIWEKNKDYFNKFDIIVTSDTAPLSRIFLQNGWNKPIIIWICNRFDYYDGSSLDCKFPDQEYYNLIKKSFNHKNVYFVSYSQFEYFYAQSKGVTVGTKVIKPTGMFLQNKNFKSGIPDNIAKEQNILIPQYHNNTLFIDLKNECSKLGLSVYAGRYNGPEDLKGFKGIINIPGAWSNFAFFESLQNGTPYFVPSIKFVLELYKKTSKGGYFIPDAHYFFNLKKYEFCDWYFHEYQEIITYFDSWQDLKNKINQTNFVQLRQKILNFGKKHKEEMLSRWKNLFQEIKTTIN